MSDPRKHHFIPKFWLARWAGANGKLVRYDRPVPTKIMASWRYPSEVGWLEDLYRYPDDESANEQWLERKVFQRIDSLAAPVLNEMLQPKPRELNASELSHWALLIRSLMHRTPENLRSTKAALARIDDHLVSEIQEHYSDLRGPSDPPTYADYVASVHKQERERASLRLLPSMIANARVGSFMVNMRWCIFSLSPDCPTLLLSDDPIARTNGIRNPGGHLAMPLSPHRLLVMAESDEAMRTITSMPLRAIAEAMNTWTVESARWFVVAADRRQERFIRNRFGINPKASLTADLGKLEEIAGDGHLV